MTTQVVTPLHRHKTKAPRDVAAAEDVGGAAGFLAFIAVAIALESIWREHDRELSQAIAAICFTVAVVAAAVGRRTRARREKS